MLKKIFLLIIMFLALMIFGFGYAHNNLIDYYEIGVEDIGGYIKSFNTAKDIGEDLIEQYNRNWVNFVESIKPFDFQLSWYFENLSFSTINLLLGSISKLLFYPINLVLHFVVMVFNQLATSIYYFWQFVLWAGNFRRLL